MDIFKKNKKGNVSISLKAIATLAANTTLECYGVLGLAEDLSPKIKYGEVFNGVQVTSNRYGVTINIYIVVAYGLKVTEVVTEVQKKVRYILKKALDIDFKSINVFVQSMKMIG